MWSTLESPQPFEAERRAWLKHTELTLFPRSGRTTYSSHALLLFVDAELAFCAGAWASVIVMSHAIVEATLRQIRDGNYRSSAYNLIGVDAELQWLRSIRNEVLHAAEPGSPSSLWKLPPNDVVACHSALEAEAKRAVTIAYKHVHALAET